MDSTLKLNKCNQMFAISNKYSDYFEVYSSNEDNLNYNIDEFEYNHKFDNQFKLNILLTSDKNYFVGLFA